MVIKGFNIKKCLAGLFAIACLGCHTKPLAQKAVATVVDSNTVAFKGGILSYDALQQLKQATLSAEEWSNVLPVVLLPADAEKNIEDEPALPGTYTISDTAIVFKARKPFEKLQPYVAHFYSSDNGLSYLKMAQAKQNLKGPEYIEFKFEVK